MVGGVCASPTMQPQTLDSDGSTPSRRLARARVSAAPAPFIRGLQAHGYPIPATRWRAVCLSRLGRPSGASPSREIVSWWK